MKLSLLRSDFFWADLTHGADWYSDEAGGEVAERFINAVEATLSKLQRMPGQGRPRFKDFPELAGIRSIQVQLPFGWWSIFYRYDTANLHAERLIHGARDLPRRLLEAP